MRPSGGRSRAPAPRGAAARGRSLGFPPCTSGVRYDDLKERVGGAAQPRPRAARAVDVRDAGGALAAGRPAHRHDRPSWRPDPLAPLSSRAHLGLREQGTRRLLEVLSVARHPEAPRRALRASPRAQRKWLDPGSSTYVGDFLADNAHYWEWWQDLERLVRDGRSMELHDKPPEDPYWRSYITGQYQLAGSPATPSRRPSGCPTARARCSTWRARTASTRWPSAAGTRDCSATVVDLPGSARIGREIVADGGHVRARAPRRGGHVRDRPRRPPRRGARVQHHPSPLARADPGAVREGGSGAASGRAAVRAGPVRPPRRRTRPTTAATWVCSSTSHREPTRTPPNRSPVGCRGAASTRCRCAGWPSSRASR